MNNSNSMTSKKIAFLIILVSLFFAGAMIISSWLIEDKKLASFVMFGLIALWWIPYSYLISKNDKK